MNYETRDKIIIENMYKVDEVIYFYGLDKFVSSSELEDLKSTGYLALTEAIISFKPELEVPLDFWVRRNIYWAISRLVKSLYSTDETFTDVADKDFVVENIETSIDLKNFILKLNREDRDILYDVIFFGKTFEEIGKDKGISKQAVSKQYLKIISALSKKVEKQ